MSLLLLKELIIIFLLLAPGRSKEVVLVFVICSTCFMLYFVLLYLNTKANSSPQLRKRGIHLVSVRRVASSSSCLDCVILLWHFLDLSYDSKL